MASPETGLVTTTPQASLVLLDAHPDLLIQAPVSNTTGLVRALVAASMPNGVLGWEAHSAQFHLYTDSGTFALRRNEIAWPDGTTLRGEDVAVLLDSQTCTRAVPSTSFAARSPVPTTVLRAALPQDLPTAPPGTVAVLRVVHGDGTPVAEGDGEQLHLRTTEGWFTFRGNCITFPHGQMLCGEELCPLVFPLTFTFSLSGPLTQQGWCDTGIDVPAHTTLLFSATGIIFISGGNGPNTPNGSGLPAPPTTIFGFFLVPGLWQWSLVGKVGGGTPFQVGTSAEILAGAAGRLFLAINDDLYTDNSGDWEITITLLEEPS